jgi:hypothetical protein
VSSGLAIKKPTKWQMFDKESLRGAKGASSPSVRCLI